MIFNSVIAGCVLLTGCFALKWLVGLWHLDWVVSLKRILPIKQDYFGVTSFSFIIGIVITELSNLAIDETAQIKKAINKIGNNLERLLLFSADNRKLIQVTLKNDKVYVGICSRIPVPDKTNYIDIIPFFSGYRNPETKRIVFTTDYLTVYSEYIKEGQVLSIQELEVNVTIKSDEILSANRFDIEMYDRFNGVSAIETQD